MKYVLFFGECESQDINLIGEKGLSLVRLHKNNFKVPPGFIISKDVFELVLSDKRIKRVVQELLKNPESQKKIKDVETKIKYFEFPEEVADEIIEAYLSLSVDMSMSVDSLLKTTEEYVAVRNSPIGIDSKLLKQRTILNIKGKDRLFKAILESYAINLVQKIVDSKSSSFSLAIIVQKMIDAQKSGVASSINQENNDITINACFGLGEGINSGNVFPDVYTVDKKTISVKTIKVIEKQFEYVRDIDDDSTIRQRLGEKSKKQVLYNNEIIELARLLKKVVNTFDSEQSIDWAIKDEIIYIMENKNLINETSSESVQIDIYEESNDEVPDMIDISDSDIEEDLQVFDEIQKIESENNEPSSELYQESHMVDSIEGSENIQQNEDTMDKIEVFELDDDKENNFELDEELDEKIEDDIKNYEGDNTSILSEEIDEENIEDESEEEDVAKEKIDDSIFSSYKGYDSFNVSNNPVKNVDLKPVSAVGKLKELALLNAANTVIYCHMVFKVKFEERLRKYVREIPEDFISILNELLEYEPLDDEDAFRKIDKVRNDFVNNMIYPTGEDVQMALRLID